MNKRIEAGKILDFLEENGFTDSKTTFEEELKKNNLKPVQLSNTKIQEIKNAFEQCEVLKFWSIWDEIGLTDHELEFFLQIYFCFSNAAISGSINEEMVKNGQVAFKTFIENRDENTLPESDDFQLYFGLPYIPKPHTKSQFMHIFTPEFSKKILTKLLRFLKSASLSLHDAQTVQRQKQVFDQLTRKSRKQESEIRKLEEDYSNILQLALELMDLLQASIRGQPVTIGNDIFERLSARLVSRPTTAMSVTSAVTITPTSLMTSYHLPTEPNTARSQPPIQNPSQTPISKKKNSKYDMVAVKNDILEKGEVLQALRIKLTKSSSEMERMRIINEYIVADILGCSSPSSIHHKNILMLLTSQKVKLRETLHRFVNTLASIFPGRSYLANSLLLVPALENAFFNESRDISREHLLGSLQKLSLRRALQSQMIQSGKLIPWLVDTLAEPDNLSDYVLEYSAALLMNLCLRTKGRYSLIGQAQKTLQVLSDLLSHENPNFKAYVNGSLYSVLSIQEFKDYAKEMGLEALLSSFMKKDEKDTENYGQLEYIKQQISNQAENRKDDSDDEDGDEEEDADAEEDFEADLDISDCYPTPKRDILDDYLNQPHPPSISISNVQPTQNDHFLRPRTPGQKKLNLEGRDSIVIGESVNIDLSHRSKSEFISDDADLAKIFERKNSILEKENNPNYASLTGSQTITSRSQVQRSDQAVLITADSQSDPSIPSIQKQLPEGYRDAFGAKPKIPRTPDIRN